MTRKVAENNDGAAERITGVAGQTSVRGKQVYIFPEEKPSPDPQLSAANQHTKEAGARGCCGVLRKAVDNSLVMQRVAEKMSKKYM